MGYDIKNYTLDKLQEFNKMAGHLNCVWSSQIADRLIELVKQQDARIKQLEKQIEEIKLTNGV